jgi:Ca-activated chloride channel family protein
MRRLLIAAALVLAAVPLPAQAPPPLMETVSVGYVMIPFTALGSKGRPLTDLAARDVTLLVDGQPVQTDLFEKAENAAVSFTILVDASGSMGLAGKKDAARGALNALLARRKPGDEFALYVFSDADAREVVPFTTDVRKIELAFETIEPYGKTAFFDALAKMPERSRLGNNPSRAIILLSDGIDNASKLTKATLAEELEGIATPIYPLGLRDAEQAREAATAEERADLALLDEIATLTGGRLHVGNTPVQLARAVETMDRDLRAQYLIGFSPTGKGAVKYRTISLRLAGRVRAVRVRAGYRGTEPPVLAASTREKSKRNERNRS